MARARNIKPGFFTNDSLGELEPLTRILFIGLWCVADREGRLVDRPKKIKAEVLPYDNCDVDKLLDDLYRAKFIIRYEVNDERYIQISNFSKHQNPHPKEAKSVIPTCTESNLLAVELHGKPIAKNADSLQSDSLLLIPDSLNNYGENTFAGEIVSNGEIKPTKNSKKDIDANFEALWKLYPHKKGKGKVTDATKVRLYQIGFEAVKKCIERYEASKEDWQKWQHGSTFFYSGYVDYLDGNYTPSERNQPQDKPKNSKYDDVYL